MPRLSEEQKNRAIGMLMAGVAVNVVSQAYGCTRQTIHKLMTRYMLTGTVLDRQRPFYYVDAFMSTLFSVDGHCQSSLITCPTIRNRLRKNNCPIRAGRPYKHHIMGRRHRFARLSQTSFHLATCQLEQGF